MTPEEQAAAMAAQQGQQGAQADPQQILMQNNQMLQEIGQMVQEIGQMIQQGLQMEAGEQQAGGGPTDEEALRQEAMRRLQAQQGA